MTLHNPARSFADTVPRVHIDDRVVEVSAHATVLEAAREAGVAIPTLCHRTGIEPFVSCMVCVVRDTRTGKLIPSCAHPVMDGMTIDTCSAEVRRARREAVELLLSDHVGDCEAPCRRICPAALPVPRMLRQFEAGRIEDAAATARATLLLPGVLGAICPAPCEKGCRRGEHDAPVAIRDLHRHVAEQAPPAPAGTWSSASGATGRVAMIGAGPAGLSAAWHLATAGVSCTIFDEHEEPGGALRYGVDEAALPRALLDAELAALRRPEIAFRGGVRVGRDLAWGDLRRQFEAVVLAVGASPEPGLVEALGLETAARGLRVDRASLATGVAGVFAAGDAVHGARMAVRAISDGRRVAGAALRFLEGDPTAGPARRFDSRMGRLLQGEIESFLGRASAAGRVTPEGGVLTPDEARTEAERCLDCDCRKAEGCRLRACADALGARQDAFRGEGRRRRREETDHPEVSFEPAKCIRCGLCVRIARAAGEPLGMTFLGRGYDMEVDAPFHASIAEALTVSARACVEACPTAALSFRTWDGDGGNSR